MSNQSGENLLYTEHKKWLQTIDQTKSDLRGLQERLEALLPAFTAKDVWKRVEQFQNKFIRQREVIDELRHEVKQHENHLEKMDISSQLLLVQHVQLREDFQRFYALFVALEREFDEFLA